MTGAAQQTSSGWAQTPGPNPPEELDKARGTLTLADPDSVDTPPDVGAVPAGALAGRPSVTASRTGAAPSIDGRLDDVVWQNAARITRFVQEIPIEGARATEDTEVHIAFDRQNLYFGIYAHYSNPGIIRANRVDRDQAGRDDTVSVFFDPFLDQQRAYVFSVNAYGVRGDSIVSDGGGGGGGPGGGVGGPDDSSWNALFSSAGQLVADGWTAEMAIPFKSLRYPARAERQAHRWGFQVRREIQGKNERVVWAPTSRDVMGFLGQMGLLEGLSNLSTSRNLEILPTFTAVRAGALTGASGRFEPLDTNPEVGVNVKYGITSNLTADFTVNPDFSQIESDEAQIEVNQRFPIFYRERRPFFLEGQEIFTIPGPVTLVHTRTIVDPMFGAKITGKVGRTTVGLLVANDEAPGHVDDAADPAFGRSAGVFIGRARYDLYPESHVGVVVTNREFMDSYSRLGGLDARFRLGRNHRLGFKLLASDRRDEEGVRQSGPLLDIGFRREGRNLSYGIFHFQIHPEFGTDTGFVRRVDTRQTNSNVQYRWWPERWIQSWGPRVEYSRNYDFDGVLQDEAFRAQMHVDFASNINVNGSVSHGLERYEGIPFDKTRVSFGGRIDTSRRISIGGFFNSGDQVRFVDEPFLGRNRNFNVFLTLRPFSRLQSQIDISTSRFVDPRDRSEVFDAKIFRALTTYQFTNRILARNISEYNSYEGTVALNVLLTYRVNAGTAFYVGYDDHYQQGDRIEDVLFTTDRYQRTNRAIFTKLQYLFRY